MLALVLQGLVARAETGFELEPGLEVALVAAEPEVVDPIAMAFDEQGRLFVVEGRGYPVDEGKGTVALLDDPDGDGQYERVSDFAGDLRFPTGVMPWKAGIIVTDAPDVLYLEDTDGDAVADHREVVLTGFETKKSTQLRVNDPTLAPDGWIYFAGGLSGGEIRVPGSDAPPVPGGDVRWHPLTGRVEALDGRSQYGIAFDNAWRRFLCTNRIQNKHVVLPSRYLQRNPRLAFSESVEVTPADRVDDLLQSENPAARLFPISDNVTTADSHAGTFSAACAVTIYRGTALPERYHGASLACDPTANLVHVDRLVPDGATYSAVRFDGETEFLRSRDNAFRPVFLVEGPGGALFVCDMQRDVIEHPDYLPEEVRARTDFQGGRDRGRIYRVSGAGDAAGAWERDTAMRLAIERGETFMVDRDAPAESRVVALWMGRHDGPAIARGLEDPEPMVRETALRILAGRGEVDESLEARVLELAWHDEAKVGFWAAVVLGEVTTEQATRTLGLVGLSAERDRWLRAAVLSGVAGREREIWELLLAPETREQVLPVPAVSFIAEHAELGVSPPGFVDRVMASSLSDAQKVAALSGIEHDVAEILAEACQAISRSSPEVFVRFLGHGGAAGKAVLANGIRAAEFAPWMVGALRYLDGDTIVSLLDGELSPVLRQATLARLVAIDGGVVRLFDLLEEGKVPVSSLGPAQRAALERADAGRARELFQTAGGVARMAVYAALEPVAKQDGDPGLGREVFAAACASCHRLDGTGFNVGPDLYGIRNQSKEAILLHVVVPNHEVLAGFTGYAVTLKDGRGAVGLIGSDTPTSLTLRQPLGLEETFLRDDIERIEALPQSLMPDWLEANWSEAQLAGLLAFLRGE